MMWLFFISGQVLNVLRQAKLVAQSKNNPINSPWKWVKRNAIGLAVREVGAITVWLLLTHHSFGPALVESLKPGWGQYANILHQIPFLALPFGMVFSIWADERLESSPSIKNQIPRLED